MLEDENLDEWLTRTRAVSIELLPQLETKIEQLNKELESSKVCSPAQHIAACQCHSSCMNDLYFRMQ